MLDDHNYLPTVQGNDIRRSARRCIKIDELTSARGNCLCGECAVDMGHYSVRDKDSIHCS